MMATANDLLPPASRPRTGRPTTVSAKAYRKLWRAGIEAAPTKWASPPPRMSWRQALLIGCVQIFALLCLMRWLGYFPVLRASWLVATGVGLAVLPYTMQAAREGRYVSRAWAWARRDSQALAQALDDAAGAARDAGQRLQKAGRLRAAHRAYLRAGARARRADSIRNR